MNRRTNDHSEYRAVPVNTMAADALIPDVAMSSAAMVLTTQDKRPSPCLPGGRISMTSICHLKMQLFPKIYSAQELTHIPPGQNGRRLADDIFICIFTNEKFSILMKISLNFVPKGPINNNPALA